MAYGDEHLEIGFNAKYLLEIANQVDRENAVFMFNSSGDPTLMSTALAEFLSHQGWEDDAARAGLFEQWREIVGEDVAEHVHVESWNDGQLVLRADSTAWATQVRLLTASLLERVRATLGPDVVESVQVKGPQAPSWRAGPRVVKGRGPRDTYG